jgi:GNAT superfamily N-acetyltransferase
MTIGRLMLNSGHFDPAFIIDQVNESEFELVIVRVPALTAGTLIRELSQSLDVLVAETLLKFICHDRALESIQVDWNTEGKVRSGLYSDESAVFEIAHAAFKDHRSHFSANPIFDPELINLGYAEWATSELKNQDVFLVHEIGEVISGFLSLQIENPNSTIVLNAVNPIMQGRGIYKSLLREALRIASEKGAKSVSISTPSTNPRPINVWIQNGFKYSDASITLHILNSKRHSFVLNTI